MKRTCPFPRFLRRNSAAGFLLAGALLLALAGCRSTPPHSQAVSQLTPAEARGRVVFRTYCASCHNANSQKTLVGPGLQGLFQKKYLPSGAPANDDRVRATIQDGRAAGMPPFGNVLNAQQIDDLLAYLHTL